AMDCLRQNLSLELGDSVATPALAGNILAASGSGLAVCLAECGEFAAGIEVAEQATQIAQTGDRAWGLGLAHVAGGFLCLRQGVLARAIVTLEHSRVIYQASGLQLALPLVDPMLGLTYALAGRHAEGLSLLEQAVEQAAAARVWQTTTMVQLS